MRLAAPRDAGASVLTFVNGEPEPLPAGHLAVGESELLEAIDRHPEVRLKLPSVLALRPLSHPLGHRRQVTRPIRVVSGGGDDCVTSAVGGAEPEAAATQVETASQRAHHAVQGLAGRETRLQHRRYFRDDPDTGVLGIEGGDCHRR